VAARAHEMEAVEQRMVTFLNEGNTLVAAVETYKQR
jgi:exosome complex RNA-binding protein Rrp4